MRPLKLRTICEQIGIECLYGDITIKHITNDIREINHQTVVFYLNRDREVNIDKLAKLSNCFIITDQPILKHYEHLKDRFLFVLDADKEYKRIIKYYRSLFNIPVVAITGTCGKTTTKEMIKQILATKFNVVSTIVNRNSLRCNNDYLFTIDEKTDVAVFETAVAAPRYLLEGCEYFQPTIGVITTIGIDHLSECKTIDNYFRAKGEMLAGLKYRGTLIINRDDENIMKLDLSPFRGKIITYGINNQADFRAENVEFLDKGMSFTLNHLGRRYQAYTPGLGVHNVSNALASLAVLTELGLDIRKSIERLAEVKLIRSHLDLHPGINGSTIIDDTWSSNPTSMKAALKVLQEKGKDKVKIAVLGKIYYLGDYADEQYKEIGKMITKYGVDYLVTTDSSTKDIAQYAIEHGFNPHYHFHSTDNRELKKILERLLDSNSIALFKVSMYYQKIIDVMRSLIR